MLPLQANITTMHGKTYTKAMAYPLLYLAVFILNSWCNQFAYAATPLDLYIELKGEIQCPEGRELPQYFHLDVYHISNTGDMTLARTGRQIGAEYKTYLRKGYDHILVFDLEGFTYHEMYISKDEIASTEGMLIMDVVLPVETEDAQSIMEGQPLPVVLESIEEEDVVSLFDTTYIEEEILKSIVLPELIDTLHIQDDFFEDVQIAGLLDTTSVEEIEVPLVVAEGAPPVEKTSYYESNTYYIATTSVMPLYEKFGGKGEVLTEVTNFESVEVLEQTTSNWWMVEYQTEIGWVNAKQLGNNALTTSVHQSNQMGKE